MRTVTFIILVLSNLTLFGQVNTSVAEISQSKKIKFDSIKNSFTYSYFHFETDTGKRKIYLGVYSGWGLEKSLDYTVTNLNTNKIVFKRQFPFSKVEKIENDSIVLMDFNFDSITDFYINFDLEGWGGYFIYNQAKDTFVKDNLLSSLNDIRFDFHNGVVTGERTRAIQNLDDQGVKRPPVEFKKEKYRFEGVGLKDVTRVTKKCGKDGKCVVEKTEKGIYKNQKLTIISTE